MSRYNDQYPPPPGQQFYAPPPGSEYQQHGGRYADGYGSGNYVSPQPQVLSLAIATSCTSS